MESYSIVSLSVPVCMAQRKHLSNAPFSPYMNGTGYYNAEIGTDLKKQHLRHY